MLAENLKKARKNSGYSQDEVATKLSITRQSIVVQLSRQKSKIFIMN